MTGNPDGGGKIKTLLIRAAGNSTRFKVNIQGSSRAKMHWTRKIRSFKARNDLIPLEFVSLTTDNNYYGPALDNVMVTLAR